MRAYCQTCDSSQTISAEDIYSPDFDFWCPSCRSVLILENDAPPARVEDERGPLRFDAKTRTDDESPATPEDAEPPQARRDVRAFDAYAVLAAELDGSVAPPAATKKEGDSDVERRNDRATDRQPQVDAASFDRPTKADEEHAVAPEVPGEGPALARTSAISITPERNNDLGRGSAAKAKKPTKTSPPKVAAPPAPADAESPSAAIRRATIRATAPPWDEDAKKLHDTAKSIDIKMDESGRSTIRSSAAPLPVLDPGDDDVPSIEDEAPVGLLPPATPRSPAPKTTTIRAPLPPLPNWDGGDTMWVKELARKEVGTRQDTAPIPFGETMAIEMRTAPRPAEPPLPEEPKALDEAPAPKEPRLDDPLASMEVVQTIGTRGTGSRTYERDLVAELPASPKPKAHAPAKSGTDPDRPTARRDAPRDPGRETSEFPSPLPASAATPSATVEDIELTEVAATADAAPTDAAYADHPSASSDEFEEVTRPEPTPIAQPEQGRGEDLDWYALINEALPEMPASPEDDASRVIIRLPEEMAPKSDADAEQVRTLQAKLEARGRPSSLDSGEHSLHDRTPTQELLEAAEAAKLATLAAGDSMPGPGAPTSRHRKPKKSDSESGDEATSATETVSEVKAQDDTTLSFDTNQDLAEKTGPVTSPETVDDERPTEFAPRSRQTSRSKPRPGVVIESFTRDDLDPGLVCARDAGSSEADHFRQLYQTIFHSKNGDSPKAILVTSAARGEGKTTVAANLAVVAARMPGRGALLIEADPRGGSLLRYFGVRVRAEGLLEALGSSGDPGRFIMQFKLGTLDVLPLGVPGSDATELLTSDRMGELVNGLRARYSDASVIIDGSSVLNAPDPLVIARHVDGVVLVVRAGETPREQVARARALLGDRIIGVVLNDVAKNITAV
jgi:capsular exopolysaccharide synthesis family protein